MATTEKKEEPNKPLTTAEAIQAFIDDVRHRVANPKQGTKGPNLDERMLAIGAELGQLEPDGERVVREGSSNKFKYHSISQVERYINALQVIYRVRIKAKNIDVLSTEGRNVSVRVYFSAVCGDTGETEEWEWVDDGSVLTHAGSYAVKYGLMKYFHMSDGQDPDLLDHDFKQANAHGNAPTRAPSRTQSNRMSEGGARPAVEASAAPAATVGPNEYAAVLLSLIAEDVLPKTYLWNPGKVIALVQAHEVKRKQNKLSEEEKNYTSEGWVFHLIAQDHIKDHGKDGSCDHIKAAQAAFSNDSIPPEEHDAEPDYPG